MGLPLKLLGADEHEVLHLRTHAKCLVRPALAFLLLAALLGAGLAAVPRYLAAASPWAEWGLAVALAIAFVGWCVVPFLRWRTTTYTLTDRRIITRAGILTRRGHDLPLARINDVTYTRGIIDRLFGCGTLVLQTAAADPVVLPDIPDVERVHVAMTELLFEAAPEVDRGRDG